MGYLSSLSLSFFICQMEQIIASRYLVFTCVCGIVQMSVNLPEWKDQFQGPCHTVTNGTMPLATGGAEKKCEWQAQQALGLLV